MKSRNWRNYKKGLKIMTHKFYEGMCKIREGFQPRASLCKNKLVVIVGDEEGILEAWADYFKGLLNPID
jgi:hypothetical protein